MDSISKFHQPLFNTLEKGYYRWCVSKKRTDTFYRYYERFKLPRRDIRRYRNIHRGERCFILGGGPSLKQLNPAPLQCEYTFGVNGIFLIFDWLGFQPTYYCVEDWLVYEDRSDDIMAKVTESICFFPIQFRTNRFRRLNHKYYRAIYEFQPTPDWPNFTRDPSRLLWIGGTVTYVCMQLAWYMGFSEVYLIGMDHSYVRPDHVREEGNEWTSHGDDPNHFHPEYFGNGYRWHNPRTDRMESAYSKSRRVFEESNRSIYNATKGGKLEVFERVDYDSLF